MQWLRRGHTLGVLEMRREARGAGAERGSVRAMSLESWLRSSQPWEGAWVLFYSKWPHTGHPRHLRRLLEGAVESSRGGQGGRHSRGEERQVRLALTSMLTITQVPIPIGSSEDKGVEQSLQMPLGWCSI